MTVHPPPETSGGGFLSAGEQGICAQVSEAFIAALLCGLLQAVSLRLAQKSSISQGVNIAPDVGHFDTHLDRICFICNEL
ncbi:hypothetical protein PshuTeo2_50400 (plasmid) [Pseudomonas hunanensis]|nr:hypothetical protein APA43_22735 [Pseudomonas aeruginosa]MDY7069734.1 hypothetical protein [Pseudomonas extremaustralis]MDY7074847.1 hypothetical protein [Pseudomonas hunanensis]MDZ3995978.1 hypothetical protein [Pseudomonas sp. Teo4]TCT88719.1 hypothetical protein EC913_13328 [Pseudomonas sp. LP_4_YM]WPX91100.1 hypothetical protein PsasTeo6_43000 [Pseudomonas asiatica]